VLPTDQGAVDVLAAGIGEEAAFAGELFHRGEHSLELVAVWLHHMRGGAPCPVIPVLTGSFARFVRGDGAPADDARLSALLDGLRSVTAGRRALVVASGDLAHVGPAFGGKALRAADKLRLRGEDEAVLAPVLAGDAEGFFGAVAAMGDRNNVCGLSPVYLALRLLGGGRGELLGYEQCPADERETSLVSVGGVILA
jgi:AmmeMemoRadiSam system protein B